MVWCLEVPSKGSGYTSNGGYKGYNLNVLGYVQPIAAVVSTLLERQCSLIDGRWPKYSFI